MRQNNLYQLFSLAHTQRRKPTKLGQILVDLGYIQPMDLLRALAIRRGQNAMLGEILVAHNVITHAQLIHALSTQYNIDVLDISGHEVPFELVQNFTAEDCFRLHFIPLSVRDDTITLALANPSHRDAIKKIVAGVGYRAEFVLDYRRTIQDKIAGAYREALLHKAKTICPAEFSCRDMLHPTRRRNFVICVALGMGLLAMVDMLWLMLFFMVIGIMMLSTCLKLLCIIGYFIHEARQKHAPPAPIPIRPPPLPSISVLVPLFRETNIAERLIARMKNLKYPRELLEICLVVEENDTETRAVIDATPTAPWMQVIVVPHDDLRTKPRALNYALDFTRGEVVGIYDAEDAPQHDQLYKVAEALQNSTDDVACVQAELDYYNARTNWLSRCFTLEYATLFRTLMKGQTALRLPVLLGGTSVFFKRDILEKLGRWDAHNVTEDADLGVRLYRKGYRCACVESVTFEEANCRPLPWIGQRSRWLKGFLVTWVVHIKRPVALFRDIRVKGVLCMTGALLGAVNAFIAPPFVLPMALVYFGYNVPMYDGVPLVILAWLGGVFLISEVIHLGLYAISSRGKGHRYLRWTIPTLWLYWPLGCFAALKAFYEIVIKPTYWVKTPHGIGDEGLAVSHESARHKSVADVFYLRKSQRAEPLIAKVPLQ